MKNKKLLFAKLTGLTLAIYWFISKGGTQSVDSSFGLQEKREAFDLFDFASSWMIWLIVAYLVFIALRNLYSKHVRKPKSNMQKKYAKLRR